MVVCDSERVCSVEGCGCPVRCKGLCGMHYQRMKTKGDVGPAEPIRQRHPDAFTVDARPERGVCLVAGCQLRTHARGLCNKHYNYWKMWGKDMPDSIIRSGCSVDGCDRKHKGLGFCGPHLQQAKREGRVERPLCADSDCERPALTSGYCERHYAQVRRAALSKQRCRVDGCSNSVAGRGLCGMHYYRLRATGDVGPAGKLDRNRGWLVTSEGYVHKAVPGRGMVLQHRLVMEEILGRPLLPHENVHHINGDRADNRPENLELWSKTQPSGQRVADKVAWAIELLELYAPEALRDGAQLRLVG